MSVDPVISPPIRRDRGVTFTSHYETELGGTTHDETVPTSTAMVSTVPSPRRLIGSKQTCTRRQQ